MISLGIDIGGTGCKCVAFRETGEQIAMSYREYPVSYTHLRAHET